MNSIFYTHARSIRNPSFDAALRELQATDFSSIEQLEIIQLNKLNQLVQYSRAKSSFYKDYYSGLPESFTDLAQLSAYPIIERRDLIQFNDEIHTRQFRGKTFFSTTSASTGETLTFREGEA